LDGSQIKDEIDMTSLVSPLRYDILVREDFIAFYLSHRDLHLSDFDAFIDLARRHPYYTWFKEVMISRFAPHLVGNETRIKSMFAEKIRDSVALYNSIVEHEFDKRFPIELITAVRILPTTTGKMVSARYFVGDGCHRLTCLKAMGWTTLSSDYFRVRCFREFIPLDNTARLVHSIPIEAQKYFAFLSSRYSPLFIFEQGDDFVEHIRENGSEFLEEVLSLIRGDGMDAHVLLGQRP